MISIIVPVFNGEKTLSRCIDSVVNQYYTDWELILIDDGSTDGSIGIIDNYASKSDRIVVIHQENEGVVSARNAGLAIAKGEWLSFIDCDDWIEPDMYALMYSQIEQCKDIDIVWCDVNECCRDQHQIIHYDPTADIIKSLLTGNIHGWLWNKIYRRDYWNEIGIRSDATCNIMEDSYMLLQIYVKYPRIKYVDKALYNYSSDNYNSATSSGFVLGRGIVNITNMYNFLISQQLGDLYKSEIMQLLLKAKIDLLKMGELQSTSPYIGQSLCNLPIPFPQNVIYWIGLNCGTFGRRLFNIYNYFFK